MRKYLLKKATGFIFSLLLAQAVIGQGTPEILYYKFNGTGTTVINHASAPPAGTSTATINGALRQDSVGTCGGKALMGSGVTSTTDYVNTNWATDLRGSWTISMWTSNIPTSSTLFYIFGDATAGSFRCFTNGVAGPNNWLLRGPIGDLLVSGGATSGPNVTTFVMDSAAGKMYGYLNGTLVTTTTQAAIATVGTGPLKVCGYGSNVGLPLNGLMDEFRFYKRALSASEIANLVYGSNTTHTITTAQCGGVYKSPSGKYTWSTSGSYKDTLTNAKYCDSIITVNLTIKNNSTASISPVVCDSYKSPSNKKTWTTSGTYKDTLPNAAGCDSIITINLTVKKSTSSTIAPTVCDSYTSPSGKVYTTSGTYMDTIPNGAGCDSVITIGLKLNYSSSSTISPTVCDSYISPSGKIWTVSGAYTDTIPNTGGCDSVITVNLTVNYSSTHTLAPTVCDTYTSPSGKIFTLSGVYSDTIPNGSGCDSVITISLTVNYTSTSTISPVVCNSYTSPAGHIIDSSGSYTDTIPNSTGCDSIITINLTVNKSTGSVLTPTVCDSYTSPSGKVFTASANFVDTIPNTAGCDSIIGISLTVNTANVNISQSGFDLTAAATGATYQWLDCGNSFAVIGTATSQTYTVTANGSYAVEVTQNGCTDTSACITIANVGVDETAFAGGMAVYPNPTGGKFTIMVNQPLEDATVIITDVAGKVITQKAHLAGNAIELDITGEAAGIYFIEIADRGSVGRVKITRY